MDIKLSPSAELALARLNENGFEAFVVGGCVRDSLMAKTPSDFDVTTNAFPEDTKRIFSDFTTFESGAAHGTVAAVIHGEIIEITTYRYDGEYEDHRHPVGVSFTDKLEYDLSRRDFTVNAMAYNRDVGIVDLFGGQEDIESKIIRCVGIPEKRFEEDALRIIRALRFSSVLGFEIEEATSNAVLEKAELLLFVSRERIYAEMKKLVSGIGAARIIRKYKRVFDVIFGGIDTDAEAVGRAEGTMASLAVFFYSSPEAFASLKPSRSDSILLKSAIALAKDCIFKDEPLLKHMIVSRGVEAIKLSLEIRQAFGENIAEQRSMLESVISSADCLSLSELAIGGRDIIALGAQPSPRIGEILSSLFEDVLNGKLKNDKETLINEAKSRL